MSNEKKNPLIGAFRTPAAGAPPTPAPTEPPTEAKPPAAAALPVKAAEVNKAVGPTKDGKPAAVPTTPAKQDASKKPPESIKAAETQKPVEQPKEPVAAATRTADGPKGSAVSFWGCPLTAVCPADMAAYLAHFLCAAWAKRTFVL